MSSVRKSLAWSFSERYASQVVTLISSMILARLLTPEQIGIFSLCAAVTAIATIFRDFGVSEYIIQEKELTKDKLKGAYALAFIMAWIMAGVLFFSRGAIADFYNEQGVAEVIAILSINFIILPFSSPGFALINRAMDFNKIFMVQFYSTIIHAVVAVILANLGYSYMSLAWASLANIVSQTVLITILRPRESLMLPSVKSVAYVWRFGMTVSVSRTIEIVMNNAHELIIGRQFGFAQLGIFSRAIGLINLFWTNVTSAVTRVAAPSFAASYHRSEQELLNDYKKAISVFTVVAWPFFCFVAIESHSIIYLLFGDQWGEAAPIASILAISQIISSLIALAPNALIAMGRVKRRLWVSMILAPVHIIGILIASMFDIVVIAIVWTITWLTALVLYNYHLNKTLGFTYKNLITGVKKSFIVTVFSVFPVLVLFYLFEQHDFSDIISLSVNAVVISILWFFAIYIIKHPVYDEILYVFKSIRKLKKN